MKPRLGDDAMDGTTVLGNFAQRGTTAGGMSIGGGAGAILQRQRDAIVSATRTSVGAPTPRTPTRPVLDLVER